MITVGVTGAIGSGKTTVCREWEKRGAKVVYADELARELMVSDHSLRQSLTETFGDETYHEDGSLNKQHLIHHAFEKGRVEELNRLVHPAVARNFRELCIEAEKAGEKMVVEEAALLLNKGRSSALDVVVIVKSDRENRIPRVVERDKVTVENVLSRDAKQPDFNKKAHFADHIIENNGSRQDLIKKADELFTMLVEKYNLRWA